MNANFFSTHHHDIFAAETVDRFELDMFQGGKV